MTTQRNRARATLAASLMMIACVDGCAHRREVYYGRDPGAGAGVSVRAPFVNVQVRGKPKSARTESGARDRDREENEDRKVSRLPVDRED